MIMILPLKLSLPLWTFYLSYGSGLRCTFWDRSPWICHWAEKRAHGQKILKSINFWFQHVFVKVCQYEWEYMECGCFAKRCPRWLSRKSCRTFLVWYIMNSWGICLIRNTCIENENKYLLPFDRKCFRFLSAIWETDISKPLTVFNTILKSTERHSKFWKVEQKIWNGIRVRFDSGKSIPPFVDAVRFYTDGSLATYAVGYEVATENPNHLSFARILIHRVHWTPGSVFCYTTHCRLSAELASSHIQK